MIAMTRALTPMLAAVLAAGMASACGKAPRSATSNQLDRAIAFFELRLEDRPGDILTPGALADRYMMRFGRDRNIDDVTRAESVLQQGLDRLPEHPSFVARMTAVHIARHEFPEALDAARWAWARTQRASANGPLFDAWFEVGQYDSAAAALNRMNPNTFSYLIRRARFAEQLGDLDTATRAIARACRADEARANTLGAWCAVRQGTIDAANGSWKRAAELFHFALEEIPEYPPAIAGLAASELGRGNLSAAHDLYDRLTRVPGGAEAYLFLARIAEMRGDTGQAGRHRKAFEDRTEDARYGRGYWSHRARLFAQQGRIDSALVLAEKDLEQRPGPEAYHTLAVVLLAAGRAADAQEAMTRVFTWGPGGPEALYHAGLIALANGRAREGHEYLQWALNDPAGLSPDYAAIARAATTD
jgi:tetratricopeptide (TPR) repeat protein